MIGNKKIGRSGIFCCRLMKCILCKFKRFNFLCFLLTLIFVLVVFMFIYNSFLFESLMNYTGINKLIGRTNSKDWKWNLPSSGTESSIRIFDVDEDGLDDILFGIVETENDFMNFGGDGKNEKCNQIENKKFCEGSLLAIRGYDGKILWKIGTKSEIFVINCDIDLNKDGKMDCLGAGRKNTFIGFDPRNGDLFWDASYRGLIIFWNIYSPVVLPYDFDNDGVNEIVISVGGNPTIPSDVHDRDPGVIFTVSGRTGEFIGYNLTIPESKETYMSPVLHVQEDNSAYLLIGSGGETVPGNLYIISLPDFYDYVMKGSKFDKPKFKGEYVIKMKDSFALDKSIDKLYILYKAGDKGVMVPPVLVDIDKDGNKDILVSSFDGKIALYNGLTFKLIWERSFDCYETYTSAAPGYFNEDNFLDLMLIQNLGTFDRYANSSILVLDGKDGSTIWQMDARRMEMASVLTLQTTEQNRDVFFVRIQGVEFQDHNSIQQVYHGIEPQQPPMDKIKRDSKKCPNLSELSQQENFIEQKEINCDEHTLDDPSKTTYGLLVDRTVQNKPILILESKPTKRKYTFTEEDFKEIKIKDLNISNTTCIIMEPMERNTGAIGYFTAKNELDVITIVTNAGMVMHKHEYVKVLTDIYIYKKSLSTAMRNSKKLNYKIQKSFKPFNENEKSIYELSYNPNQTWNTYMGYKANSVYDEL